MKKPNFHTYVTSFAQQPGKSNVKAIVVAAGVTWTLKLAEHGNFTYKLKKKGRSGKHVDAYKAFKLSSTFDCFSMASNFKAWFLCSQLSSLLLLQA